ncbi:structure-specific endonuclease subunit SLX1 [Cajanus cajan]|uniref:Structure-specific endonuclease subunit SLX1 homolog n=1 Tax=Cajanus cajan TaxID=3821 RepID=A0A151UA25_CAJCA|nr:structure-specific endonuclease subunit SLX1 [Cajanus cajan]KYP76157.1 Structure-specific endonuclease subunit SLX1 [Cajanus cajan]
MRKKKVASAAHATVVKEEEEEEEEHSHDQNQNQKEGSEGDGFYACYLLASLSPRYKGHTYIGFTVNPRRRIRQHNGEIGCGAWRTKKRRPWEMVLCIYGFPTNVSALQFEWAWQHPVESLAVRKAAVGFKSLSGIANKIKLAYTMLNLPSWQSMNITVNFFSTKYMKHCAGCPSLPVHMKIKIGSLDELPCYSENNDSLSENEDDNIDEVEFDNNNNNNNTRTSDSVPDVSDDFVIPDSPKNSNHRDNISETFEQNKESEARKQIFASQEQLQPFSSTTPMTMKSSSATLLPRIETIEEADFMGVEDKSGADFCQPEPEQSGATLAEDKIRDVSSTYIVPHDAEIIDLSTPSPSCRSVLDRKKRRVSSSIGTDFIDLTNSPNFVQL